VARSAKKYYSFPVVSITKSADGDDLVIVGKATDGTLDHDLQVVDPAFSGPALKTWLATGGNVRMSHDPRRPIGRGVSAETDGSGATWVTSRIVDPLAQKFIRKGVLQAYSVGIADARIRPDPAGRATGGIICGGTIAELTVCDRPSNPSCGVTIAKARSDGSAEFVAETFGMVGKAGKVERHLRKAAKLLGVDVAELEAERLLAVGGAAARELGRAWDLNSDDPFTRELAHLTAGSPAVSKAAGTFVDKALRSGMLAALDSADPVQREMARKALGGRRG
jgi:hypothetical protein